MKPQDYASSATGKQSRILLIEDEGAIALAKTCILTAGGYSVDWANTGEAAIKLFGGGEGYDLVVADVDLGEGIDGIEAARRLTRTHEVPVLFLTSRDIREVSEQAKDLGRYGYLRKDSDEGSLLRALDRSLRPGP